MGCCDSKGQSTGKIEQKNVKRSYTITTQKSIGFQSYKDFHEVEDINTLYSFTKKLGSGAFGTVYKGVQNVTQKEVAIKKIYKEKIHEEDVFERLLRNELSVLEQVDHPNIVRTIQLLEDKKCIYVVMELLPGQDLLEKIKRVG